MPEFDARYGFPPPPPPDEREGNRQSEIGVPHRHPHAHPHPGPLPKGEGDAQSEIPTPHPHPDPLPAAADLRPEGEGDRQSEIVNRQSEIATPHPHAHPHPSPLPEGEGAQPIDRILEELVRGQLGPLAKLSDTIDCTLDQVAKWVATAGNRKKIQHLVTLLDAQAQLLICQHRVIAVARLAQVAATAQSPETVRRACFNLLRIRLIDPYREDKRPPEPPEPVPPPDTEAILATLERLAEESDARNRDDTPPPGWTPPGTVPDLRAPMWPGIKDKK